MTFPSSYIDDKQCEPTQSAENSDHSATNLTHSSFNDTNSSNNLLQDLSESDHGISSDIPQPIRQSARLRSAPSYLVDYQCHLSQLNSNWCNLVPSSSF